MLDEQSISALQNLLLGVAGNGLTSLIAASGNKVRSIWSGKKMRDARVKAEKKLSYLLNQGINIITETTEGTDLVRFEIVCLFLKSTEVEAIVRQIFAANYLEKSSTLSLIQEEFLTAFSLFSDLPTEQLQEVSKNLFALIIVVCEEVLSEAIENGILSALDAKAAFRQQVLLDELSIIQRNLDLLKGEHTASLTEILDFERDYRKQVQSREGFIRPPFVDATRKYPIDEIYVSPIFSTPSDKNSHTTSLADFLGVIHRAVILGNPGGGKSTLTQKICNDLANHYDQRLIAGRSVTPIRVILRDFSQAKKERRCSILDFITSSAKSDYQITPPPGAFEHLLLNGRVIVLFDGLDELLETRHRQEISDDVEAFCARYSSVPVIVTSRFVGYEQAPLSDVRFRTYLLAPFSEGQTKEYVQKWFALGTELSTDQQDKKVKSFLYESRFVPDLRSNPLMLALMCNIYQGENYIPRNRPEVYRKCAEMLFERWDKSRGIATPLPIEAHIRPAMMHLAHWIYTDENLQVGVTERALIDQTTQYLMSKRFEDIDEAAFASQAFIEFCRGRAWVFTDTGTTKRGERLYQFTHRTFLEYFTASHLVRTLITTGGLMSVLLPRIVNREWDVVAQLAVQIQYTNVDDAGDEIIEQLLIYNNTNPKGTNIHCVEFAARCLNFIIPSPKVCRKVVMRCLEEILEFGIHQVNFGRPRSYGINWMGNTEYRVLLEALLGVANENRKVVSSEIERFVLNKINSSDEKAVAVIIEMVDFIHNHEYRIGSQSTDSFRQLSDLLWLHVEDKKKALQNKWHFIAARDYHRQLVTLKQFIQWYGLNNLFVTTRSSFTGGGYISPGEALLGKFSQDWSETDEAPIQAVRDLEFLGSLFENTEFPYPMKLERNMREALSDLFGLERYSRRRRKYVEVSVSPLALSGAFILYGMLMEHLESNASTQVSFSISAESPAARINYLEPLRKVILSRTQHSQEFLSDEYLEQHFGNNTTTLIKDWIKGSKILLKKRNRSNSKNTGEP